MSKILVAAVLIAAVLAPAGARGEQAQGPGFVVFVTDRAGSSDIYSSNTRGGAQTPLVATAAEEADPAVAPRGAALAWASTASGSWQIYVARSGEAGRPITSGPRSSVDPAWSPSGRQIAFETNRTGNWEIFVMNADGSGLRNVSRRQTDDFDPVWRDDKTIAFTGTETPDGSNLYRTTVAATPRAVPITRTAAHESDPAYAPNRTRIALTQLYGLDYEIAVTSATAVRPQRLTRTSGLDVSPAWTGDGSHLVFTSSRDGDLEIYEIPAAGGEAVNLTQRPASNEWEPEFAATLPKISSRGLSSHAAAKAVPWFTCNNPSPLVAAEGSWTVVNGTTAVPPATGDRLCGNAGLNRVLAKPGTDKLAGGDGRDHLEGGNHNDLFLTPDGFKDCLYGGFNNSGLPTVSARCLDSLLGSLAVYVDDSGATNDLAWPDKGLDLRRGIDKVEP